MALYFMVTESGGGVKTTLDHCADEFCRVFSCVSESESESERERERKRKRESVCVNHCVVEPHRFPRGGGGGGKRGREWRG